MIISLQKLLLNCNNEGSDKEFNRRVDESVKRILKLKLKVGLFENAYTEEAAIAQFGKEEYKQNALDAALKTMTLLKNDDAVLPLKKGSKIVLAGPNANNVASMHGCWSYTWQGADQKLSWDPMGALEGDGVPEGTLDSLKAVESKYYSFEGDKRVLNPFNGTITIREAFENVVGAGNVTCNSVGDYEAEANYKLPSTAGADAIVLCLGENSYAESPGFYQRFNFR